MSAQLEAKWCKLCHVELDQPYREETTDCGGDCLSCMADLGDEDALEDMARIRAGDLLRLTDNKILVRAFAMLLQSGAHRVRLIHNKCLFTQDFDPERINVFFNEDGSVKEVTFG